MSKLNDTTQSAVKKAIRASELAVEKLKQFGLPIDKINAQRQRAIIWFGANIGRVIIGLLIAFVILFYFIAIYNRIPRYLARMEVYNTSLVSVFSNIAIMNGGGIGDYVLGDFWIASSYKSYLPCTNSTDYSSIDSIKQCIKYGARFIDLDIYNSGIFDINPEPVVCNGKEIGNWHYTTELSFEKVCKEISMFAFNPEKVGNSNDPLFLNLNFKTWGNKRTINKAADIIIRHFSDSSRLMSRMNPKYSWQGRKHRPNGNNIAAEPIKNLKNKLVILCTGLIKDTKMDELCQIYGILPDVPIKDRAKYQLSGKSEHSFNMGVKTHKNISNLSFSQASELKDFNKGSNGTNGLTMVIPDFKLRTKENYNCWISYYYGCSFVCMNYTEPSDFMLSYAARFKTCSFLLKPLRLRYEVTEIPAAVAQSIDHHADGAMTVVGGLQGTVVDTGKAT